MTGSRCSAKVAEFGEQVHYREANPKHKRRNQEDAGWRSGTWMGLVSKSKESYIGTDQGVVRAVVFRRRSENERWNAEEVQKVQGTVRSPDPSKPERDQVPIRVDIDVPEQVRAYRKLEVMPRHVYFNKSDFEKFGYTDNCNGVPEHQDSWG